jgi:polysaccharide biosynthesis/export protein
MPEFNLIRNTTKAFGVLVLALLTAHQPIAPAQAVPVKAGNTASRSGSLAAEIREGVSGDDYLIGADDVLAINVWKEPDLSRTVPVRPDGRITLPLIGDIAASGTTPRQLQASIEQDLSKYISKPAVTVIVQEAKSHKFNIVGEVQKPGAYVLTGPMTVLDAIALAGGFRDWAKVKSIYVLRPGPNGSRSKLAFNYKKVIKGGDGAENIQLKMGDTVVVP